MKHIGCISFGKDSVALALLLNEIIGPAGEAWIPVHEVTKWEVDGHNAYAEYINRTVLNGSLQLAASTTYPDGFVQLVAERGRVPSAKARFCTEELKTFPCIEFCKSLDDEVTVYLGHRREESSARAVMCAVDFDDRYDAEIRRPLLDWPVAKVFEMHRKYGIEPNPLYSLGVQRVGCFPCVMVQLRELKALSAWEKEWNEIKRRVELIETMVNSSFFPPNYIPKRFHSGEIQQVCGVCGGAGTDYAYKPRGEDGLFAGESDDRPEIVITCKTCRGAGKVRKTFPWRDDVWRYIESTSADQMPILEERSCMSAYNQCE